MNALKVDDIGIGTAESSHRPATVVINQQLVFCGCLGNLFNRLQSLLVGTFPEIEFKAFDAHLGIFLGECLGFVGKTETKAPKYHTHVFPVTIGYDFLKIHIGICSSEHGVVFRPTGINQNIRNAVLGSKINTV